MSALVNMISNYLDGGNPSTWDVKWRWHERAFIPIYPTNLSGQCWVTSKVHEREMKVDSCYYSISQFTLMNSLIETRKGKEKSRSSAVSNWESAHKNKRQKESSFWRLLKMLSNLTGKRPVLLCTFFPFNLKGYKYYGWKKGESITLNQKLENRWLNPVFGPYASESRTFDEM